MKIKTKDKKDEVLEKLTKAVKEVESNLPLISALGNKSMQKRHWTKVFALLNEGVTQNYDNFSFQTLLADGAGDFVEEIDTIAGTSQGEALIEANMEEVKKHWDAQNFTVD